jgi:hypothetical protein
MFLTGQEEIESAVRTIREITRSAEENMAPLVVCPLYAALPSYAQLKVFKPTPKVYSIVHYSQKLTVCFIPNYIYYYQVALGVMRP